MKVYISGAITDNPQYKEQFKTAERWLKLCDCKVVNPAEITNLPFTHDEYLQLDFKLIELCDCIYMLKGWQKSKGACAELSYAKAIGKEVKYEEKQWKFKKILNRDLPFPEVF